MSRRVRVKQGKAQSIAGLIFGLLFCCIGLFIVIPTFGLFGIIWTLFAVVMTVMSGVNAFSNKGIASHEITIEDEFVDERSNHNTTEDYGDASEYSADSEDGRSSEERLNELQGLYNKGLITTSEYQEKRKQILEEL